MRTAPTPAGPAPRRVLTFAAAVLVLCTSGAFTEAHAQAARTPSFDLGTGLTRVQRDVFNDRVGPAVDAHLVMPLGQSPLLFGLGLTGHVSVKNDDSCTLNVGTNACRDDMPSVGGLTASVGAELVPAHTASRWSVRVFAGAGAFRISNDAASLNAGGAIGRLDIALPIPGRVTVVLSGRSVYLPAMPTDARGFQSVGLGMRLR